MLSIRFRFQHWASSITSLGRSVPSRSDAPTSAWSRSPCRIAVPTSLQQSSWRNRSHASSEHFRLLGTLAKPQNAEVDARADASTNRSQDDSLEKTQKPTQGSSPTPLTFLLPAKPLQKPLVPTAHTNNILLKAMIAHMDHATLTQAYDRFRSVLPFPSVSPSPSSSPSSSSSSSTPPSPLSIVHNFTTFIRAFIDHRDFASIAHILSDMRALDVSPSHHTYSVLLIAYQTIISPADTTAAQAIFDAMQKAGGKFAPNAVHYNLLMRAYAKNGNFSEAKRVFRMMMKNRVKLTEQTVRVARWGKAREMALRRRFG